MITEYSIRDLNLSFGRAFDLLRNNTDKDPSRKFGIRLPSWKEDVVVRIQVPTSLSYMTAPYLYVDSRFGRVPWKETMIELFATNWQFVEITKEDTKEKKTEYPNEECSEQCLKKCMGECSAK
jgi:hypothetical protein